MSKDEKFNSIVYPAEILICNWIKSNKLDLQVKNSAERISTYSMRITAIKDGVAYVRDANNDKINVDTEMIPVKITSEEEILYGTDWCLQSPIKEIYFDAIPRWWPKEWLTTPKGEYADQIIINLGTIKRMMVPEIEISCNLSKKQNEATTQNYAFCELYSEESEEKEEMKKINLFNKDKESGKSEKENNVVVKSEEETLSENNSLEENTMANEVTEAEREEIEEVVESKKFDKKSFFIGVGVGAVAVGVGVGTVVAAKHFGWFKKDETPSVETE